MNEFNIEVESGKSVKLTTAGKYCDRDIVVTATGGGSGGYDEGFEAGKQAEYDSFWDAYQEKGGRLQYVYAFSYSGWRDSNFNPKYPITPANSNGISSMMYWNTGVTDTKVPITVYGTGYNAFSNSNVERIPMLIFSGTTNVTNMFFNCTKLEELTCDGELSLSLSLAQSTKLTKKSIESIINVLSDTATGQTLTLSKEAVDREFGYYEDGELLLPGSEDESWATLVDSKPNWTISLV